MCLVNDPKLKCMEKVTIEKNHPTPVFLSQHQNTKYEVLVIIEASMFDNLKHISLFYLFFPKNKKLKFK